MLHASGAADARRASLTGVVVVGLSSFVPAAVRFMRGEVPVALWLTGLPGILIGAFVGPKLAEQLGVRRVMMLFCAFLLADIVRNAAFLLA